MNVFMSREAPTKESDLERADDEWICDALLFECSSAYRPCGVLRDIESERMAHGKLLISIL